MKYVPNYGQPVQGARKKYADKQQPGMAKGIIDKQEQDENSCNYETVLSGGSVERFSRGRRNRSVNKTRATDGRLGLADFLPLL